MAKCTWALMEGMPDLALIKTDENLLGREGSLIGLSKRFYPAQHVIQGWEKLVPHWKYWFDLQHLDLEEGNPFPFSAGFPLPQQFSIHCHFLFCLEMAALFQPLGFLFGWETINLNLDKKHSTEEFNTHCTLVLLYPTQSLDIHLYGVLP